MKLPKKVQALVGAILVLAALLVLVKTLVLGGIRMQEDPRADKPAILPSGERLALDRSPPTPTQLPPAGELDLLSRVQVRQDAVCGSWGFQAAALYTSPDLWGRLQFPCIPPEEYDWKIRATRKQGAGALVVGIVYRARQGTFRVDGEAGETTWLDLAAAEDPSSNPTAVKGKRLKWNRPATLLLRVRASGISLAVDGNRVLEWKGIPEDLRLPPELRVPDRRVLFVGGTESMFRLDEVTLIPVTGSPTFLR